MASFSAVLRSVVASLMRTTNIKAEVASPGRPNGATEPGRYGSTATVEVDATRVGRVRMAYVPSTDGNPDPGEIVWTWVPFEERDGRGKDRPVLLVAAEPSGAALAVQLTSKPHGDAENFVSIGRGSWDAQGRPSWVGIERVFRVHPDGMRREAAALDADRFSQVAGAIRARYGWR
ncbi:type II toxin-antitoxin system PemK/MazF family toxin [Mycetocola sp. 2940]|uniref:type II toxin-antitoxin system PemK/MazF family toxin n=1 Tax=Mycetocola sp. 2940 TaxID=3156452 RepID=UPI00339A2C52